MKRSVNAVAVMLVALLATACGGGKNNPVTQPSSSSGTGSGGGSVVVGSANFPENQLLAEIYAQALEGKGVKVTRKLNIGSREVLFSQIKSGSLTILPEYNGALLNYLDKSATASTTSDVDAALKSKLPSSLEILDSAAAEDKDSITVTQATASKYHLQSLADLAAVAKDLVLGGPPEFKTRPQGVPGLKSVYGVEFKQFVPLDTAGPITVAALKQGKVQAANLFTTDPSIVANQFVVLQDPKNLFGAQNVTPLVYTKGVNDTIVSTLNAVSAKLDTSTLADMVKKVVADKQDASAVAKAWLSSAGLS